MYLLLKRSLLLWMYILYVITFSLFADRQLLANAGPPIIIPVKYGKNENSEAFFELSVNYFERSLFRLNETGVGREHSTESLLCDITALSCYLCPQHHTLRFTTRKYPLEDIKGCSPMCELTSSIEIFSLEDEHLFSIFTTEKILAGFLPQDSWDTLLLTQHVNPSKTANMSPFDINRLIQYKNMLVAAVRKLSTIPREHDPITVDVSSTSCIPEQIDPENNDLEIVCANQYNDISYRALKGALLCYMMNEERVLPLVLTGKNKLNHFLSSIENLHNLNQWCQTAEIADIILPVQWPVIYQPALKDSEDINPAVFWGDAYYKYLCQQIYLIKKKWSGTDKRSYRKKHSLLP